MFNITNFVLKELTKNNPVIIIVCNYKNADMGEHRLVKPVSRNMRT